MAGKFKRMNRREAIERIAKMGGAVAAGLALRPCDLFAQARAGADARPNIIFILIDDLRWDAMSCVGYPPFLRTPNIDRIAKEGARFANAFVCISLCAPSRASFLTGMYPHKHGVRTNRGEEFDHSLATFPLLLQQTGYDTAFIGKWHMAPTNAPRPGFNYWLSFKGQGVYENPELNENGKEFKATGYMTDLLEGYAETWLRQPRNKPFCLYLSHKAVHGPFTPAERHRNLYPDAEMPKPVSFDDTFEGKPEWQRATQIMGGKKKKKAAPEKVPASLPPAIWDPKARGRIDYYRTLAAVDEGVGKILDILREQGKLDNTVIVFAGDNGYFMGEHRRGDKRLAYEESMRIPFLIRYPRLGRPGTVINEMALNIDLAPTLLDLAGVPIPATMQGKSFRPLLEGKQVPWRTSFLYEYFKDGKFTVPTMLAVRTESWKYVRYPDIKDLDELYDLKKDPYEMRNLVNDPVGAPKLAEMSAELEQLLKETGYQPKEPVRWTRPTELVLYYSFDNDTDGKVVDGSGKGNDGEARGARLVEGHSGKARAFDGKRSCIRVPKSASLDPSKKPLLVEAWVKADSDAGGVCAHGGQSNGYSLFIEGGAPRFAARIGEELVVALGKEKMVGKWTHLAGRITPQGKLELYVNGALAGTADAGGFIAQNPNDGMTLGADEGSRVTEHESPLWLTGMIDDVRVYHGDVTAEEIKKHAM